MSEDKKLMASKGKILSVFFLCLSFVLSSFILSACDNEVQTETAEFFVFDTVVNITAYGENGGKAIEAVRDELYRYDDLLSTENKNSDIYKLKDKKVIPNITLNQKHFEDNIALVDNLISKKLIYGLGVSLENPTREFIEKVKRFPNAVIHVINGIVDGLQISMMTDQDLKILILGYKNLRRGANFISREHVEVKTHQYWLYKNLPNLINKFAVVSFDNLAIEQLAIKERWNEFSDSPWYEFYAGDDGMNTYYIDMVDRKFARSSTADFDKRYDLLDDVDEMFKLIKKE